MKKAKRGKLVGLETKRSSFLRIIGPAEGAGPYAITYDNVSPQLILVLEDALRQLKGELFNIIQYGEVEEG